MVQLRSFLHAVVAATLYTLAYAIPAGVQERGTSVLPTDDAFYSVPSNVQDYAPGSIIRVRKPPSPIAALGLAPANIEDAWQILFRTNDNLDNATATVLTVLVPHKADFSKLLSYQVAEDAAYANCAPSYAFQLKSATSGFLGTIITQAELLLIESALARGWVVIVPDHEGPSGAFLANKLAGQATLDGVRAALNSANTTGIAKDPTIALWGYSGGSLASAFAAELQPSYAPELKIAGIALGGTVPSIPPVITSTDSTAKAGLIPTGMLGLAHQYPELQEILDGQILPEFKDSFDKVVRQCFVADILSFLNKNITAMVRDAGVLGREPAASILAANALGKQTPTIPLFVYKAVRDEVSPVSDTDALVANYCSRGATVTYQRDMTSDHGGLAIVGAAKALSWLIDVMNNKPAAEKCSTQTVVSSLFSKEAFEVFDDIIRNALLGLLGQPIGPSFIG
ncbi:Lipase, secreted [Akanthomyces lecanii RCEF 1005]|uniref:Lipase, secreted n=1 Tax=Akanthomyces lecanii RCEF 1005 TaxID=1081108 RepID=A0A168CTH6_CORDF|nr:Lipase, secreted [Akanthomyces lecanii RCEF 1005]